MPHPATSSSRVRFHQTMGLLPGPNLRGTIERKLDFNPSVMSEAPTPALEGGMLQHSIDDVMIEEKQPSETLLNHNKRNESQFRVSNDTKFQAEYNRGPRNAEQNFEQWTGSNRKKNQVAENERKVAEKIISSTQNLIEIAKQKTESENVESVNRLRQRVSDIDFWKQELQNTVEGLRQCSEVTECQYERLCHAFTSIADEQKVVEQCSALRLQRHGSDKTVDSVDKHLEHELNVIKNCQDLLKQSKQQVWDQNRLMNKSLYQLSKDLKDKEIAKEIDENQATEKSWPNNKSDVKCGVNDRSKATSNANFTKADVRSAHSMMEWQKHTEQNILDAKIQIKRSLKVKTTVDSILAHVASTLRTQKDLTDRAFTKRIEEVKSAKIDLERHLSETEVKIGEVELSINDLDKEIIDKCPTLKVCRARIQTRKKRPNVELVHDDAESQLANQNCNLVQTIRQLDKQLTINKSCYTSLQKVRLQLQDELSVKKNTLFIDEVKCMSLRKALSIHAY